MNLGKQKNIWIFAANSANDSSSKILDIVIRKFSAQMKVLFETKTEGTQPLVLTKDEFEIQKTTTSWKFSKFGLSCLQFETDELRKIIEFPHHKKSCPRIS